jgi:hypothetical protein
MCFDQKGESGLVACRPNFNYPYSINQIREKCFHSSSSTSGLAYDTMKNAINPATPSAANIGTNKITGVPNNPARRSDKTLVGSKVAADTFVEVDSIADRNDGGEAAQADDRDPSIRVTAAAAGEIADNCARDIEAVAPTNDCPDNRLDAGANASQRIMTANSCTTTTSTIK